MTTLFDFSAFPVLETPRLVLREITPDDAHAILSIRGDIRVSRLNSGQPMQSLDQALDLIETGRQAFADQRRIDWGITLKDQPALGVIGRCGFNYILQRDRRASIGYDLAFAQWGNGIMTEAVRAMITFGFERLDLNRIEADAAAENIGSIRVLEKVGFKHEGVQEEQYFEWDEFHDLVMLALLKKDFDQREVRR